MSNLSKKKRDEMIGFIEKLRTEHKDDVSMIFLNEIESFITEKKYGLVWEKHTERVDEEMVHNIPVFKEVEERKIKALESNDFNFLLEGDNLHSLRLLEKTHKGKIDIIYIDPPYNRGKNDFVYDDDLIDKQDGYRHSKWLSFMSERLSIARELLTKEGIIFISIDDNEQAQLKLLMDEIFGEENFINNFVWQRNSSVKTDKDKFTVNTEYVLLYSKTRKFVLNTAYKPLSDATVSTYNKDDDDGRGKYASISLQKPRDPGPETTYDYVDNNGKVWKCPKKGWRMIYSKIKALENDDRLILDGKTLRVKDYWNERESTGKRIDTLWNDLPENTTGSSELDKIMGHSGTFDNPKPTKLIERCLEISNPNAIVLDFFAGSGTTGHAVVQLNKEDGGNRKYILCTNNENNICEDVTYQRLKNVQKLFPHNLKYFKTDLIRKFNDDENIISEHLLSHIKEMVELEHMMEVDNENNIVVLTDEKMDKLFDGNINRGASIYIPSYILVSREQQNIINKLNLTIVDIPDYYFADELREVGEI